MSLLGYVTRTATSQLAIKRPLMNSVLLMQNQRLIATSAVWYAGHSKWQNIRHIKAAKDQAKARVSSRTVQEINVAIKEGNGPDPKFNIQLARVIERAEKMDVPKQTILNALKKAKEGKPRNTHYYDMKGPGNCSLIVEALTEHVQKTKSEIVNIAKRHGAKLSGQSNSFFFDEKGMIYISAENLSLEQAEEVAIECGAEEVEEYEEDGEKMYKFICASDEVFMVKKMLELKNIGILRFCTEFIPTTLTMISEESQTQLGLFLDKVEALDDVVRVYDNVDVSEESS